MRMRSCTAPSVCALLAATTGLVFLGTAAGAAAQNATAEASPTLRLLFVGNSLIHYSGSAYKAWPPAHLKCSGTPACIPRGRHVVLVSCLMECMPEQVVAQLLKAQFPGTWVDSNEIWWVAMD